MPSTSPQTKKSSFGVENAVLSNIVRDDMLDLSKQFRFQINGLQSDEKLPMQKAFFSPSHFNVSGTKAFRYYSVLQFLYNDPLSNGPPLRHNWYTYMY